MYLVLSTAKLRSIIATLGRHEHASSLRRKLWSVGWRAVAHVATVFLAVLVFLAYPDVFLVYVKNRLLIMVQRVCIARSSDRVWMFISVSFCAPVHFWTMCVVVCTQVNVHLFLVWLGWEDACCTDEPCFRCFDARITNAQYEAVQSETLVRTADEFFLPAESAAASKSLPTPLYSANSL